ncbi:MAG TPA: HAD hydrolase-like protein [Steroidobacteraceae bacterium]|nr:HAD hydrolase-like protein [Steroidobacteraceae bacterium]
MNRIAKSAAPPHLKGLMFDLDGTLLLSDRSLGGYEILPGAAELLTELSRRAFPFVVLTNGSAYPPAEQAEKLRRAGLPVRDECMLTPSSVAADLMRRARIRRALILGSSGVGQALRDAGIETLQAGERGERDVQAVYVGWYPECTMQAIEAACHAIWAGARLYVASDVPFFATKQGRTMGYSHAITGAIRRVTGAPMILTGKPSLHALRFVARRLGLRRRELGIVGDDPSVEIIMARRGGAKAFAVTTGVTARKEWERQTGLRRPERILRRLGELLESVAASPSTIGEGAVR